MTLTTIRQRWGDVLDTKALAEALGYPSRYAVRKAIATGTFPISVRWRGHRIVASAEDVAGWWNE